MHTMERRGKKRGNRCVSDRNVWYLGSMTRYIQWEPIRFKIGIISILSFRMKFPLALLLTIALALAV